MLAKIHSAALIGLSVHKIQIEIDSSHGLPSWDIVGLPDASVKESKERVKTALKNSGFDLPPRRIIINLAPADLKKEGPSFDLAIAIAILATTEQISLESIHHKIFLGELGLDGTIHSIKGLLPISMSLKNTNSEIIVPESNAIESAIGGTPTYGFSHLKDVVSFLHQPESFDKEPIPDISMRLSHSQQTKNDFADIKGQREAKRALEIAAAGGHNLIMIGSPGSGKTMLARAFPSILPPLTLDESLECTEIHSIAGLLPEDFPLITTRPFRSPHHTASSASLIGGGRIPTPGEVTLSHNGVLFMDEFPEYRKDLMEALRQPLEDGHVTISRVNAQLTFPCNFILIAAMNPCPCGFLNDPKHICTCSSGAISRYQQKVSGPLLDRFDLQLELLPISFNDLYDTKTIEESSDVIRKRVIKARKIQLERFNNEKIYCNANMSQQDIKKYCNLNEQSKNLLKRSFEKLGISARAHNRILKLARTIADLENVQHIESHHIAEAIQYRTLDKALWKH